MISIGVVVEPVKVGKVVEIIVNVVAGDPICVVCAVDNTDDAGLDADPVTAV